MIYACIICSVVPSNAMNFTTSHNCVKLQLTNSVVNGQVCVWISIILLMFFV